jgi:hypothetical protein
VPPRTCYDPFVADEAWRREFPDLQHEPQDLDLVRRHLGWTPAERLANLLSVLAFVERARKATWLPRPPDDPVRR